MPTITSRQNPLVSRYRDAARRRTRQLLLLDGEHLIADALRAGVAVRHAAVTAAARERRAIADLVAALERARVEVATVSAAVMDAISPVRSATGIVAMAEQPGTAPSRPFVGAAPLAIVAVDVQDPGNVGAIVRVAEAAGATGVVAAGASADPFGWKALRGSMGSALRLPLVGDRAVEDAIEDARRHGCRILAAAPRGGRPLHEVDFTGPLAILIGNEGAGLSSAIVDAANERIAVPMKPPVESLNAAVTAAVIVYEARRQRANHGPAVS